MLGHAKITTTEVDCQPEVPDLVMETPNFHAGVVEDRKTRLSPRRAKSSKINGGWYRIRTCDLWHVRPAL